MSTQNPWRLLVLGSTGAIGAKIAEHALGKEWEVVGTSRRAVDQLATRQPAGSFRQIRYDPMHGDPTVDLAAESPFDAVCWAHGANVADSLNDFDPSRHLQLYEANCLSILVSLAGLLKAGLLREGGARLVVISSIWQERARANKLSYIVTKAAVSGIVRSAAVDLGKDGHLINGILPGVLDTPMTAANLTASQIEGTRARTPSGKLPDLGTVADMALFLCSAQNQSITGQSVTVDQGMSNAILI